MSEEQVDFLAYSILCRYASGVPVVDIGDEFNLHVNSVYSRMKECPEAYKQAKADLLKLRNAKYRRAGALAIDLQLKYLEEFPGDMDALCKEIKNIQTVGEAAERRADLNEGKPTERKEAIGREMTIEEMKEHILKVEDAGTGLDEKSISA